MNRTSLVTSSNEPIGRMHIGGKPAEPHSSDTYPIYRPGTGAVLGMVPEADAHDVNEAVEAACTAARGWAKMTPADRARHVSQFADAIADAADEFALLDSRNGGHPISGTRMGAIKGAETMRYFAGIATEAAGGRTVPATSDHLHLTVREPFGVVGVITAYNHPTLFAAGRTGAALVAGNAVVLKPAEQTPLSAIRLAEIAVDYLPAGVFNVVTGGRRAGTHLVRHPNVRRVNFTGSLPTALAIQSEAAASGHIKRLGFQLGGKNPLVVLPDVSVEEAAAAAVEGMNLFKVLGQSCGSTSRAFVHESIYKEFLATVHDRMTELAPGDPEDERTQMGALVTERHRERVESYVSMAHEDGARLVCGGKRPTGLGGGFFYEPTVFADVTGAMRIGREEVFGPILSAIPWKEEAALVNAVNDIDYGLTAAIYTHDVDRALRLARSIEVGYIWINDVEKRWIGVPFGGYKDSGTSTEFSADELHANTQVKTISLSIRNEA